MRKILGYCIIAPPFVGIVLVLHAVTESWLIPLAVFGAVGFLVGCILIGVNLVVK